jgi:hypothetical protein
MADNERAAIDLSEAIGKFLIGKKYFDGDRAPSFYEPGLMMGPPSPNRIELSVERVYGFGPEVDDQVRAIQQLVATTLRPFLEGFLDHFEKEVLQRRSADEVLMGDGLL